MAQYTDTVDFGTDFTASPAPSQPSWLDEEIEVSRATYQAYQVMYYTFIALGAIMAAARFLHVEILTGFIALMVASAVAVKPRVGSWIAVAWLLGSAVTLLVSGGNYEVVICEIALAGAAVAFTRLAAECN